MISGFTGSITKIQINGIQVFPGTQSIELAAGRQMTIQVDYTIVPIGTEIAWNDIYTVGITAKMGTQSGWDGTEHWGSGQKTGTPQIGNLQAPSVKTALFVKLWGIDAANPSSPAV